MKKPTVIIRIYLLALGLAACESGAPKQAQNQRAKPQPDTLALQVPAAEEPKAPANTVDNSDCTRGAAEPILKKSIFPKATFQLLPDKITGIETVQLSNGDQLSIRNWGCESYVLTFRFETVRFQADTSNTLFWYQKTASFMQDITRGIDAPIDIKKGLNSLAYRIKKAQKPGADRLKIGDKIEFEAGDIRQYFTIDRIEKLSDKKYAVEVSFAIGPL